MFHGVEDKLLTVQTRQTLRSSDALAIEYNDCLFLGEVTRCAEISDGSWRSEIKVEQILTGLMSLLNLRERLLGQESNRHTSYCHAGVYA